jgi:hypothetical protein
MTDVTNNTAPAASDSPITPATTVSDTSKPAPKATEGAVKSKSKPKRRNRQRRRAAVSDNDSSANEDGNHSDSSASSHTDPADSEDEEEPEVEKTKRPSVFPDVSSITPAGWKKEDAVTEAISFEDFEAGKEPPPAAAAPARGTGISIRGRGKGKAEAGQKREFTPEETAKYEAQKAKRKEKVKAKRAELKEKAAKDKEAKGKDASAVASSDKPAAPCASISLVLDDTHLISLAPTTEKSAPAPTPKPSVPTQTSKAKGKKKAESTVSSPDNELGLHANALQPAPQTTVAEVTASTSTLKLENPESEDKDATVAAPTETQTDEAAPESQRGVELLPSATSSDQPPAERPPRGPRGNQREAYAQRMAEDPKFTPRVGQFWTHDQRLYEGGNVGDGYTGLRQMSPFWRGRAMPRGAFRGGFRGRGRGGFIPNGRGGMANGAVPHPVELSQEATKDEEGGSKLAMDREFELAEARDKARSIPQAAAPPPTASAVGDESETSANLPVVRPPPVPQGERKWGHEGYETMANPDQFRGARGRGRGMRARGGFFREYLFIVKRR